jgi:hypothetical protein
MEMKKMCVFVFGLLILLACAHAEVGIVKVAINPNIPHKGEVVKVDLYVRNFDSDNDAKNVFVYLQSIRGQDVTIHAIQNEFDRIEPYGTAIASFYVSLPKNSSKHYFTFTAKVYRGLSFEQSFPVIIAVDEPSSLILYPSFPAHMESGACYNISLLIENNGDEVHDVVIKALNAYPFYGGEDKYISIIQKDTNVTLSLPICVDDDVITGRYSFVIVAQWLNGQEQGGQVFSNDVKVIAHPNIVISGIETEPSKLKAWHKGKIIVHMENIGAEPIFAPSIELNASWCNMRRSIQFVPGTYPLYRGMDESYVVECENITKSGKLPFCVVAKGMDRFGNEMEKKFCFHLFIDPAPDVKIGGYLVRNPYTSEQAQIVLNLTNDGDATAEHVEVEADVKWPFSTDEKRDYICSIPPGESRIAILPVNIYPNAKEKGYGLKIFIRYQHGDDAFSDSNTVVIEVKKKDFLAFVSTWIRKNPLFSAFIALAIVVMLFFTYKASAVVINKYKETN